MAIDKSAIKEFTKRWKGIGYEKGDTQQYWLQLLRALGYAHSDDVKFEYHLPGGGFIDVWIRDAGILVEQKSIEVDLDKPEPRQGKMKTPLEQAMDYVIDLPLSEQPRFIITCNFKQFRIYDREKYGRSELADNAFEFTLEELAGRPDYLNIIVDPNNSRLEKEKQVSIEAGRLIGQLYDLMRKGYIDPDSKESQHALNVLCVRLVFCLYCEDSDLFPKDAFFNYLKDVPAQNIRMNLKRLFKSLDTPHGERDPYDTSIKEFPYVNGGLFKEDTEIPNFSEEAKEFLLHKVSAPVNWSQISPTIFGGIFESTLNPETRRKGGMHYTSPENIHKVIDPLFLDNLKKEFTDIRDNNELTPRQKKNRYKLFLDKLCSLKFFDPAAGSGNFLTETYLCLRKLEDSVLIELRGGQTAFGFEEDEDKGKRVSLNQFYGIEINDFAVTVAETALWISRLKANGEESMLVSASDDFPLHESANIYHDNALRKDWGEVLPACECSFIMGNPPFYGGMQMTREQKDEMIDVFQNLKGVGELDYVTAWYVKAAEYIKDYPIHCCFVSTNSISQGLPVGIFWKYIKESKHCEIDFCRRTFIWDSEADIQAHVHVIIVGFSNKAYSVSDKRIYDGVSVEYAEHINGYLMNGDDIYISEVSDPLSHVPPMRFGSMPRTKGFTLSASEKEEFIKNNPLCEKWIRPYWGAEEFLNRKERYCLWLVDADDNEIAQCPLVVDRINQVRDERLKSKAEGTRKFANTPKLFAQIAQPDGDGNYLLVPRVSSERRPYIPIAFVDNYVIASDLAYLVPDATLYHLGIMSSQFHNAWMRRTAGRMKSDYRYAKDLVYNTFIWPEPNEDCRLQIEKLAGDILAIRDKYPSMKIGDMYKPESMPDDLREAHKLLDKAVEKAYGVDYDGDEEKIVEHLFNLYRKIANRL